MEIVLKLDPGKDDVDVVLEGLLAYNGAASGREARGQSFALHLTDPQSGQPVGGLTGAAVLDWMFIELLHIPDQFRGKGYGEALMARAEDLARERGCIGIWLDTYSFQARPFYEKLGYTVFGTLEDHPIGGRRYFMQKRLDRAA